MITQRAKLNLIPGGSLPRINATQYDYGSRVLEFEIYNGSQRFTLANGMTARIQGYKPDKNAFDYAATVSTSNNIITANLTQQMTVVYGEVICEIVIEKSGERIGTLNFVLDVQEASLNDEHIRSDSELPIIIAQATAQMEAAAASALESEGYAKGTQDGNAVGSGSPYYQNSSKYFKEQAAASASAAGTSASNAAGSATASSNKALESEGWAKGTQNGSAVGSGSPYYQKNSKYYSEQSKASADRAQAYSVNVPYIGANGNWWVWDTTQGAYVDTGVDASITVDIADITMLAPDATPYVTNTGTSTDPVFHLFIPRGKGISSISKTGTSGLVDTYTITFSDGATTTYTVTNGKTAYQSAVEGGYTGTEAEFEADLANFKEWKEDAETAAANAAASETNAATSESNAAASARNSAASATNAAASEANAATSETNAATSEANAATSETNAAASEINANQSYLDAKAQADRAQTYADFIEPHFLIQDNRLYIKDDAVGEFIVVDNRLYMKLTA